MEQTSLHIQAITYNDNVDALMRSCESFANALRRVQADKNLFLQVSFTYGDASETPTLTDKDIAAMQACFHDIADFSYTFFDENTGFGGGHNRLAQGIDDGWLLIINPDIVVAPSFFHHMMDKALSSNTVGIVEARQTPIEHPKDYDPETGQTSWASGACMLIQAALFARLEGFDTDTFYMYCEDVDLSWRMRQQGYAVLYQPAAPAFHPKHLSSHARWSATEAEAHYSALSNLLMAYKWSNDKRLEELLALYATGQQAAWTEALNEYEHRKAAGTLPKRLDEEQKIATFIHGEYTHHRFGM